MVFGQNNPLSFIDCLGREPTRVDVGAFDPDPASPVGRGESQKSTVEQGAMELHAKLYQNPIPTKSKEELLKALKSMQEKNCCVSTLNLQTHGLRVVGGIKFRNGTLKVANHEELVTEKDGEDLGKALKPSMCSPCQINLRGCGALRDATADGEKTGLAFAKGLAKGSGCYVVGAQNGVCRIGRNPWSTQGGITIGGQPTWSNDAGAPLVPVDPSGKVLGPLSGTEKGGVGRWPSVPGINPSK
jgi:hypothetical protein